MPEFVPSDANQDCLPGREPDVRFQMRDALDTADAHLLALWVHRRQLMESRGVKVGEA